MFFLGTLDDTVYDEKLETAPARLPLLAAATASFFVALFYPFSLDECGLIFEMPGENPWKDGVKRKVISTARLHGLHSVPFL